MSRHSDSSFFFELWELCQKHYRVSVVIISLAVSTSFFVAQNIVINLLDIEITTHGQLRDDGTYFFGDYTLQVNHLLQNNSLVRDGEVLNRYTPIYPFLLYGAVRLSEIAGLEINTSLFLLAAGFIALSALILTEISYKVYDKESFAVLGGVLFATHPYILQGLTKTMSVTPFMTFVFLSLLFFLKVLLNSPHRQALHLILVGILVGISMLIRPIAIFLPIVYALLYIVLAKNEGFTRKAVLSCLIIVGAAATTAPWQGVNYSYGESIVLSSDSTGSMIDGVSFNNHPRKDKIELPEGVNDLAMTLSNSGAETRVELFSLAIREFRAHPVAAVKLFLVKAGRAWYGAFGQEKRKEFFKLLISLFYMTLAVLGIWKLNLKEPAARMYCVVFLGMTLYFWGMTILVVSMVRYMIPIFGLMVIFIPALLLKRTENEFAGQEQL